MSRRRGMQRSRVVPSELHRRNMSRRLLVDVCLGFLRHSLLLLDVRIAAGSVRLAVFLLLHPPVSKPRLLFESVEDESVESDHVGLPQRSRDCWCLRFGG